MLQLDNKTPFTATIAVLPSASGIDTLYVIIKGTSTLRPHLAKAEEQLPPTMADTYYGEPAQTSLKLPTEMHLSKPGTDVLLIGQAWAPEGQFVTTSMVKITVAERSKTIRVTGDRIWRDGSPTSPQPFQSMPLIWERAYGGMYADGDQVFAEERNPVGCGFAGKRNASAVEGQAVPNLEDPLALLSSFGDISTPACFAPVAPSWLPRRNFSGTYDAQWQRNRAPYLPDDFDARFFQCACPELTFDRYLQGGEPVQVLGCTPDGPIQFNMPPIRIYVAAHVDGSIEYPPANLETLIIEPDQNRASFTWRAALPCDRNVLKVEKIVLTLAGGRST